MIKCGEAVKSIDIQERRSARKVIITRENHVQEANLLGFLPYLGERDCNQLPSIGLFQWSTGVS